MDRNNYSHGPSVSDLIKSKRKDLTDIQYNYLLNLNLDESQWDEFLSSEFSKTHSPFLLPDIFGAIQQINKALIDKKHILLYGDRDTDGVSSTCLLAIYFRQKISLMGGKLTVKTSSANDDYGLCDTVMKTIISLNPDLLVTLDFGTSNFDEINLLADKGIKVIVLDHHEIPQKIPNCKLINPKRADSKYPEKRICTSVLSMKLILALKCAEVFVEEKRGDSLFFDLNSLDFSEIDYQMIIKKHPQILSSTLDLLDLSSVGTIADMMPLVGENRIIVKNGMKTFQRVIGVGHPDRIGLRELLIKSGMSSEKVLSKDLGWTVGPILNAAGRMGKTEIALSLLLTQKPSDAEKHSEDLFSLNRERKERTKRNIFRTDRYLERIPDRTTNKIIFCYEPDMEPGVSGIVASKLVERYKRPVVFLTPDHGKARGSVRSYGKENVIDLLNLVSEILEHFGGHPEAGGFSIKIENIPELEKRLISVADTWLLNVPKEESTKKSILSITPEQLTERLYHELEIFEPFGQGNPLPLLSIRGALVNNLRFLGDGTHVRFSIPKANPKIKGIVWNEASNFNQILSLKPSLDLWGVLEENFFNGVTSLQFVVNKFA
ncbi:MAG: single-stranded-DNA-specific exonuclease RecJ [Spirochaetia bacterium]|nr:single-stranded-DNA-specific exonuclease RecJ [Spirochaetia bacterium]